ncbi:FmdE family protein [Methanobacterium alcaliphilum]|uniref:FmdE family protein n=1 Tax=Methanobacterium alcaliphilum TaxID=392018 RepID=UPI002009F009|nr:FmdE family protein [Methanobacterium alcaliphilum]MCK9151882.1 FmdE family protein [Methanobacterium alcaliphilum]
MSAYKELLKKAGEFHGEICGGIVMGTKLAIYGMESMGMEPGKKDKNLIVFTEIDRCMSDAVLAVTRTSVGKKSLKPVGYGKFAATFVNIETEKAIRLVDLEVNKKGEKSYSEQESIEDMIERINKTPAEEIFKLQKVSVKIDENYLPGKPREKAVCKSCGELIMDGKHHLKGGNAYCTSCFNGSYYALLDE